MSEADLLARLRYLAMVARRRGGRSSLFGFDAARAENETQVIGLRDYAPGDDYRHVDWRWCARRDELLTRLFATNEDNHAYILLDVSASMGQGEPPKFALARRIAAMLGYAALRHWTCLGISAFASGIVDDAPPMRHQAQMGRLLRFLEDQTLRAEATDLRRTAEQFGRRYQRRGPVVVISDLYDAGGFQPGLDILQADGYRPRVVRLYDAGEQTPDLRGDVELFDVEMQTSQRVTVTERAMQRYRELHAEFEASVDAYCARRGIPYLTIAADAPETEVLLAVA